MSCLFLPLLLGPFRINRPDLMFLVCTELLRERDFVDCLCCPSSIDRIAAFAAAIMAALASLTEPFFFCSPVMIK